jgi:hypothetical protein
MWSGTCRAGWIRPRIYLAAILAVLSFPWPCAAQEWDSEAAETALRQARELRKRLAADKSAATDEYLRCIRLYRRVFLSNPHYSGSDDSIYEAATLYQEMAAKFAAQEYDREAAGLLRFLIKDYPASQFRPYAILRLAALGPDQTGASARAPGVVAPPQSPGSVVQSEPKAAPVPARFPGTPETGSVAVVRGITHGSMPEYTRVVINLDARVSYQAQEVGNPDRIFFDLSHARLSPDASGTTIAVKDRLVRRVRARQNQPGVVRVVLDLEQGADWAVSELSDPYRIVIDVRKKSGPTDTATISP